MTPKRGEIYLAQEATVLPGGVMYLVVSGHEYNLAQPHRRIVVEVVGEQLAAAGDLLYPLGSVGVAIIAAPTTIPSGWLTGEPIKVIGDEIMADIAGRIARHLR